MQLAGAEHPEVRSPVSFSEQSACISGGDSLLGAVAAAPRSCVDLPQGKPWTARTGARAAVPKPGSHRLKQQRQPLRVPAAPQAQLLARTSHFTARSKEAFAKPPGNQMQEEGTWPEADDPEGFRAASNCGETRSQRLPCGGA